MSIKLVTKCGDLRWVIGSVIYVRHTPAHTPAGSPSGSPKSRRKKKQLETIAEANLQQLPAALACLAGPTNTSNSSLPQQTNAVTNGAVTDADVGKNKKVPSQYFCNSNCGIVYYRKLRHCHVITASYVTGSSSFNSTSSTVKNITEA